MNALPTISELEAAGKDAGAILDAVEWDLERSIPMAANKADKSSLADDLKRVRELRQSYFAGGEA